MYAEDYTRQVYVDSFYANNSSTPSGGSGYGECPQTSLQFGAWTINSPSLIPTCTYMHNTVLIEF